MKTKSLLLTVCTIFFLVGCGEEIQNDSALPESSNINISEFALQIVAADGDLERQELLSNITADEMVLLIDEFQRLNFYPDLDDSPDVAYLASTPALPCCGEYWGANYEVETIIEQKDSTNGMLYHVGPNCYLWATQVDECGDDFDDFMLSFWFGYHNESLATLRSKLRWTSSSSWVKTLISKLSGRVYEQTYGGGSDNYNIYVCLDGYFERYMTTFDMRKY